MHASVAIKNPNLLTIQIDLDISSCATLVDYEEAIQTALEQGRSTRDCRGAETIRH